MNIKSRKREIAPSLRTLLLEDLHYTRSEEFLLEVFVARPGFSIASAKPGLWRR
jgi:hypothetical protein